jgi:hypothetical protein
MELAQAQVLRNGHVSYGDDSNVFVEFVEDAVHQPYRSEIEGRAIYDQVAFVSIIFPGDKNKKIYRPAKDIDKLRFAKEWAAFEKGQTAVMEGTPIQQWPLISKSQALELKYMGFFTVELIANAGDHQINNLMGGAALRKQAQIWLSKAKDDSVYTKLVAENDKMKNDMDTLRMQNESLLARLDALEADSNDSPAKRMGRPPKNAI